MLIKAVRTRPVLAANVAGLVVAGIVALEGAYVVHQLWGFYRPLDVPVSFFPALVMFIIRKKGFSFWFLFLYVALAVQMFFEARVIYLGIWHPHNIKEPLGYLAIFSLLSAVCLAIYVVFTLFRFLISFVVRKNEKHDQATARRT